MKPRKNSRQVYIIESGPMMATYRIKGNIKYE